MISFSFNKDRGLMMQHMTVYQNPEELDRARKEKRAYNKKVKHYNAELDTLENRIGSPSVPKRTLHDILISIARRLWDLKIFALDNRIYEIEKKIMNLKEPWDR